MKGTGGLRKLRQADPRRGKGKRSGLRVISFGFLRSMTKTMPMDGEHDDQ